MAQTPETANDRWRRGWSARVAWSMTAGVVLHAAIFVLSPTWDVEDPSSDPATSAPETVELVRISTVRLPPEREPAPPEPPEGQKEWKGEITEPTSTRAARAGATPPADRVRGTSPYEAVAGPERTAVRDDGSGPRTGEPEVVTPSELPELTAVAVERITAVRPEIVAPSPSGWVLVRNPSDIARFMREIYDRGVLERGTVGRVSVALWIDERGSVEWAEITDSSGREELDRVAVELFEDVAAFRPARDRGAAVATSAIFSVAFPWF